MRSNLFDASNQERRTTDRWALQSSKMLRCALTPDAPEIISAAGAMVAYQGQMDFSYQGSGGGMKLLKKMATGEGGNMMRTRGHGGTCYAHQPDEIFQTELEGEALTLNTTNMLAFDSSMQWYIRTLGGSGVLAGGLCTLLRRGLCPYAALFRSPEIISAAGAMVAYQGQMDFSYQGSGGGMKLLKKMATGEGGNMMRT